MNTKKILSKITLASLILITINCMVINAQTVPLTFKGEASGGTLILGVIQDLMPLYVSIETSPGESADSVAKRLADKITSTQTSPNVSIEKKLWIGPGSVSSGPTLQVVSTLDHYYLAGTETGLGIPEPPVFLTIVYDQQADKLKLSWENSAKDYNYIFVNMIWRERGSPYIVRKALSGNTTSYEIKRKEITTRFRTADVNDLLICLTAYRDGIVSAPSAIHINGQYQDEAFIIPFGQTTMPNWRVWNSTGKQGNKSFLKVRERFEPVEYKPEYGLEEKPFYQVLKANPKGPIGLYRKFLGLTPGHTYRITAALSTLEMHASESDWSLDICVAHNGPRGKNLIPEQLAGEASLANQKWGRDRPSGSFASFGKNRKTTGPGFRLVKSRTPRNEREKEGVDITLPPGVDTLTVWLRFKCSDPDGAVGFMGAGIEDITTSQTQKKGNTGHDRRP